MKEFNSTEEILDFAVQEEEKAFQFYKSLAEKTEKPWMREVFMEFAREEASHKEKLLQVKEGKQVLVDVKGKVMDLKIADYLVEMEPNPEMDYQQALVVAMKKEKAAFKLYSDLAGRIDDPELKSVFLSLAQEEAKHKLKFEIEYDDNFLTEKKW